MILLLWWWENHADRWWSDSHRPRLNVNNMLVARTHESHGSLQALSRRKGIGHEKCIIAAVHSDSMAVPMWLRLECTKEKLH